MEIACSKLPTLYSSLVPRSKSACVEEGPLFRVQPLVAISRRWSIIMACLLCWTSAEYSCCIRNFGRYLLRRPYTASGEFQNWDVQTLLHPFALLRSTESSELRIAGLASGCQTTGPIGDIHATQQWARRLRQSLSRPHLVLRNTRTDKGNDLGC